jgi:hypothetical protein
MMTPTPTRVQVYSGKKTQECGLCGKTAHFEVLGAAGRHYSCRTPAHLHLVKVAAEVTDVEEQVVVDLTDPNVVADAVLSGQPVQTTTSASIPAPATSAIPTERDSPRMVLVRMANHWRRAAQVRTRSGGLIAAERCLNMARRFEALLDALEVIERGL